MKTAIAMTLTLLLAAGLGTAFATPLPLLIRQDNSQSPPAMPQQQQPQPGNPQASCTNQYPVFSQLDKSGRGYITKKQAKQVPQLEKNFKKANTSHDGKLTEAEYTAWVQAQCGGPGQALPPPNAK